MKFHYQFHVDNIQKLNQWHGGKPLDVEQVMLMRWLLEFIKTGKMDKLQHGNGRFYYRVSHPYITSQFSVFSISQVTINRKLKDLCHKKILYTAVINEGMEVERHGSKAGYNFNPEALAILSPKEYQQLQGSL